MGLVGYRLSLDGVILRCSVCGAAYEPDPWLFFCPRCGGVFDVVLEEPRVTRGFRGRGVWRYSELIPVKTQPVTMNEGGTPLIPVPRLAEESGVGAELYVKYEGANPTGSFKDRGMTVAVSLARALGVRRAAAASTGNTAASAAAYTARAGIGLTLVLPAGKVAKGKLGQSILHGARILEVEGGFDEALSVVVESVKRYGYYPLNSFNAWRLEGQKTIAFEVYEEIGVPDYVIVPVGNGGNISAIWKGFKELLEAGLIDKLPRMIGVQAAGAAPLADAFLQGLDHPLFKDHPETRATAIRIGKPINWAKAMRAVRESGGVFVKVSDEEIMKAQRMLARLEGIGAEPAGAAGAAALARLAAQGLLEKGERAVIVVTGHALKDPEAMMEAPTETLHAGSVEEAVKLLGLH